MQCSGLWNLYGPTETTVWSTAARITSPDDISAGHAIPNQRTYIVNSRDQLVPVGVPGELLIGGAGVGRGYVSQTSLTAERFVADPFRPASGELVYRTGDLCRYRRDGAIEIVGRSDQQIKIRGFRVEPAEIESALIEHCSVRQCAVIDRCDSCGEKQLVAYMVPNDSAATVEDTRLREFLRRKLPDYMVPSVFVHTTELPRTPTGKLDRKALSSPTPITRSRRTDTGLPRTVLEWKLKKIWEEILNRADVGVQDNFFDLGGHSLLAVRVVAEINRRLNIRLLLATLFRGPTIERIAAAITDGNELRPAVPEIIVLPGRGRRVYWAPSIGIVERFPESFGLVQLMDTDVRFCGFDPAPECTSIEALAGHCIELIRADQPHGPYAIVGFCQGGHAAFEIARRLVAEGESVDLVAIIDVSADGLGRSFPQQVRRLIGRARKGNGKCLFRVVAAKARLDNATDSLNAQESRATLFNEHVEAARKYTPQRYSGRLLLIRSAELAQTEANGFYGWNELAAEVQVHTIPCRHTEMMTEPATAMIAEILRKHLAVA